MNEPVKLGDDSLPKPADHWVLPLGNTFGCVYWKGKTALPLIYPLAIESFDLVFNLSVYLNIKVLELFLRRTRIVCLA